MSNKHIMNLRNNGILDDMFDCKSKSQQVESQWTVPGEAGRKTTLPVPVAVVEELRPGGESATVQPRPTVKYFFNQTCNILTPKIFR